jgi:hypothetical protein
VAWEPSATSSSANDKWAKRLPDGPKLGVLILALLLVVLERRVRVLGSISETSSTLPACFDLFMERFFRHTRNKNLQRFNQFIFPKRN